MENEREKLSVRDYLFRANSSLEEKESFSFMENIGSARVLAGDNKELIADTTFLKAKGLMFFQQHRKALKSISEALEYNEGVQKFKLLKYQGVALGYLGHLQQAKKRFTDLLDEAKDLDRQIEIYNNLIWALLCLYRQEPKEEYLGQLATHFQFIEPHISLLSNHQKQVYYFNSADYCSLKKDYEKAISLLEESFPYCEESDLAEVYNNLASLYLKSDEYGVAHQVRDYTEKAEVVAFRYHNDFEIGKALYIKAMAELREDMHLKAIDGLYVAFEHFKKAEALSDALECITKMNEIADEFKVECMTSLTKSLQGQIKEMSNINQL